MTDCVVCRGSKRIRVPIYVSTMIPAETDISDAGECSREYPCPECSAGDNVAYTRLGIIKGAKGYPEHLAQRPEFIDRLRYGMAQELVRGMVERGMIRFEQGEPDYRGIFQTRATVGVVAPGIVAKFEERVAERQFEIAEAMATEACTGINRWGSAYGHTNLHKAQATQSVWDALKAMKAKYVRK